MIDSRRPQSQPHFSYALLIPPNCFNLWNARRYPLSCRAIRSLFRVVHPGPSADSANVLLEGARSAERCRDQILRTAHRCGSSGKTSAQTIPAFLRQRRS